MDSKELVEGIERLRKEKNAVILAHNYQIPEIQDLGDYVGDSLDLARKAQKVDADVIVFCGVDFMAETAKIINPEKTVLIPEHEAQCPMAALLPPETIKSARDERPDAEVVMYVNTHAEAKVYADCVCTSANCLKVVESMQADEIIFAPDKNLAEYVRRRTKKEIITVPDKGVCVVHARITEDEVKKTMEKYPNAKVTVHPEVPPQVQDLADHIGGTNNMVKYVKESDHDEFIIGTESGIIHRMMKEAPGKKFRPACDNAICQNMKKINLQSLYDSLDKMQYQVEIPEETADKAGKAIQRMLDIK